MNQYVPSDNPENNEKPEWYYTGGQLGTAYLTTSNALKKDGKLDMSITPDTQLCRDESMLVLGKYASIQKCFRL